jgi:NitT/TauT family transport system permease protein
MAETSLKALPDTDLQSSSQRYAAHLMPMLRSTATFLIVLVIIGILWQVIKAWRGLDSYILPNITDIAKAFVTPIQEGGQTLGQLLLGSALFTFREAALGFALGSSIGFVLAVIFAHSNLLQRGLMPYVVASQTVPILAIAPMIVIWLKADWLSVAVVSAYLTFFPVLINTLRGLLAIPPTSLELMQTYAANRWQVLTKVRIPYALPYIFTALKISATASVVGAIIGELPSGIQSGLAYQILVYNQYYIQGPERLWATIIAAALTGIAAFALVSLAERIVMRWSPASNDDNKD